MRFVMYDDPKRYRVSFARPALKALSKLFNINHDDVFIRSQTLLSLNPQDQSDGITDYPDFKYNGLLWKNIGNVILIYSVSEKSKLVFIRACYFANTKESHQTFWGIEPDDE